MSRETTRQEVRGTSSGFGPTRSLSQTFCSPKNLWTKKGKVSLRSQVWGTSLPVKIRDDRGLTRSEDFPWDRDRSSHDFRTRGVRWKKSRGRRESHDDLTEVGMGRRIARYLSFFGRKTGLRMLSFYPPFQRNRWRSSGRFKQQ